MKIKQKQENNEKEMGNIFIVADDRTMLTSDEFDEIGFVYALPVVAAIQL